MQLFTHTNASRDSTTECVIRSLKSIFSGDYDPHNRINNFMRLFKKPLCIFTLAILNISSFFSLSHNVTNQWTPFYCNTCIKMTSSLCVCSASSASHHKDIFRRYWMLLPICLEGIWKIKSHRSVWMYVISSDKHQPFRDVPFINTWQCSWHSRDLEEHCASGGKWPRFNLYSDAFNTEQHPVMQY